MNVWERIWNHIKNNIKDQQGNSHNKWNNMTTKVTKKISKIGKYVLFIITCFPRKECEVLEIRKFKYLMKQYVLHIFISFKYSIICRTVNSGRSQPKVWKVIVRSLILVPVFDTPYACPAYKIITQLWSYCP